MGKVKDKLTQQQDKEFELDLGYEEWLKDNFKEPREDEINRMERRLDKPFFLSTKPLNNETYNPLKGA